MMSYDPTTYKPLSFGDARARFLSGKDSPSDFLERCITTIEAREPVVRAWTSLRLTGARADAAASTARYQTGTPWSMIDGIPIGLKDLISTRDLPTTMGIANNDQAMTRDDSASVQALQKAGAIIVGKTVTTELGGGWPSTSTNPFDPVRTPGGSSSGSGAAVGAGMIPAALGTQVVGSCLRPAAFCGNVAIKPTMGALHRGERLGLSNACLGVHAGTIEDMWAVAVEMASRSGGDPGYPGLYGELPAPAPAKPARLAIMEGPGWDVTPPDARRAFNRLLDALADQGIQLVRASDSAALAEFHACLPSAMATVSDIVTYENRSLLANLMVRMPEKLSPAAIAQYHRGRDMPVDRYRTALMNRDELRRRLALLDGVCDAVISLTAPGVAPLIDDDSRPTDQVHTGNLATGDPIYNIIPSLSGAPALTLPLLALHGLPLGVQVMGQWHGDQKLVALGAWAMDALKMSADDIGR